MNTEKFNFSLKKFGETIRRLEEALQDHSQHILVIDGTIQRFEFVYEQCWKTLQKGLLEEGVEAGTPREVFKKAYQAGWLSEEENWLQMISDRNETSHTYDEEKARAIYSKVPSYLKMFKNCHQFLAKKL